MSQRGRRALLVVSVVLSLTAGLVALRPWVRLRPIPFVDASATGRRIATTHVIGNYYPATGQAPGVLLLGGSEGGMSKHMNRAAVALQTAGYSVLLLSYFGGPGQPSKLELIPLETFDRGLEWLREQPEVHASRIAVIGHSKGAEAALLIGSRQPSLRAVVAAAPSQVVWSGIDFGAPINPDSSWTVNGQPLPSLRYSLWRPWKSIGHVYEDGLRTLPDHRDAVIEIEQISAPVLLTCGGRDTLWPSCPMARALRERALRHDKGDVQVSEFPSAGHPLFGPRVSADDPGLHDRFSGGSAPANNDARAASWAATLSLLRSTMGPTP